MKKLILLFSVGFAFFMAKAQEPIFTEYFETAPIGGDLEGYNDWHVSPKSSEANGVSPKIAEGALFYTGYAGSNIGNVAVLDSAVGATSATQRISTKIVKFGSDTLKAVVGEKIYTAFLSNISSHSYRSYRDFFTYEGSKTSSMTRGRVFAKVSTDGSELFIAVTKNSTIATDYVESTSIPGLTLYPDVNHLFVLVYETIAGDSNDKITLYIDPDLTKSETEQTNKLVAIDTQTDYSASAGLGINLRQRGIGAQVGGIRVGKSWDAVLLGEPNALNIPNINSPIWTNGKNIMTRQGGTIKVFNMAGAELISTQTNGCLSTNLTKGLYIIRFKGNDGATVISKISLN
ncbi:MAG TPA: T9SS type A sorting domain-containing protein [Paludibacteraceae bacterium]|nr:T9SS type A sorting domain-containing protein [Paludibacteraceae bacterium]HOL00772.1 T9SS type A sorting domain-containing protein [Paludibacteraceae bacterium]HPO67169.1 T9SS type A sorting domain-containing protein [Paludibacteraceae bacterium]